ncbi:uncharacterized protein FOMMEDRAFT_163355 [Fomitiporia mediterranea MF3/22]|uniref:DUF6699 domain-containing protein n=1 Tax=Fomitiporia mediterranea (strain MF3/22) TaxID=694068 RepID=R7SG86_FOMME|nr:uncharacterized protein FOMMEDRAFT_163355 [Fomitiporia mediterranea MF3/22]EJC97440.1 hypothetical protein FOMMEDRAFT_163355 [Fomitiporia mediterranea MF3/22]
MTKDELDLPATKPGITAIRLICPALGRFADSWKMEVRLRDGGIVTIANVLHGVYEQLRAKITKDEQALLSYSGVHYERVERPRRVEFLGNKHWFAGLRQVKLDSPYDFELLVKTV